jgi:hypothetical protein
MEIKNKFDRNVILFTLIMVASFMIRCTSPIGWVILVFYKLIKERSFCAFFKSGLLIGLPSLGLFILVDSMYYGEYTFAPYNFMYVNVVQKVSEKYGVSPPTEYIYKTLPEAFT